MNKEKLFVYAKILLVLLIAIALGCFALNQAIGVLGKAQLLKDPCAVCEATKTLIDLNGSSINWSNSYIIGLRP